MSVNIRESQNIDWIQFESQVTDPDNPAADLGRLFVNSDGDLAYRGEAGAAIVLSNSGTIAGSTGATDNAVIRADGAGGSTLQSSGVTIDDSNNLNVPGQLSLGSPLAVGQGGTGVTTPADARLALGLEIGTQVQAYDADLSAIVSPVGTGVVIKQSSGVYVLRFVQGVTDETKVTNGGGFAGQIIVGLADNPVLPGTGGVQVPDGTTAQRSATNGVIRYNTTTNTLEAYINGSWVTLGAGGGGVSEAVRLVKQANQSTASGSDVAIGFSAGSTDYDTDSFHDESLLNNRIVPPADGKYLCTGTIGYSDATSGGDRLSKLRLNGSTVVQIGNSARGTGTGASVITSVSTILDLTTSDYLELVARQNSGLSLNALADETTLALHRLS